MILSDRQGFKGLVIETKQTVCSLANLLLDCYRALDSRSLALLARFLRFYSLNVRSLRSNRMLKAGYLKGVTLLASAVPACNLCFPDGLPTDPLFKGLNLVLSKPNCHSESNYDTNTICSIKHNFKDPQFW